MEDLTSRNYKNMEKKYISSRINEIIKITEISAIENRKIEVKINENKSCFFMTIKNQ